MKKGRFLTDKQLAVALLLPVFVILGSVGVIPLLSALEMAFTKTSIMSISKHKFIGLKHFVNLLTDEDYWRIVRNTFMIAGIAAAGRFAMAMGLALILAGTVIRKGKNLFRSMFILPWLVPGVALAIVWMWILGTRVGIINYLLKSTHIIQDNLPWLADRWLAKLSVITVFIWGGTPFIMIVLIAGLQAIPRDLIDASRIDGAGYWSRFVFVILPLLRSLMGIAVLLSLIYMFQNFVIIFTLTGGGPGIATETFSLYVYKTAFDAGRIGKACAIGTTWLLFLSVFAVFYLRLLSTSRETY